MFQTTNQTIWGFPEMGGTKKKWMVFVRENPTFEWMMNRGTPISGNSHIITIHSPYNNHPFGGIPILLVRFTQRMDGNGGCWDYY